MTNKVSMVFLILVFLSFTLFIKAQETITVIGAMDFTDMLKDLNAGDSVNTDLLVCNDKETLLSVLASMQNQALDTNLNLESDLLNVVALNCWVNNEVELSFENLDDESQTLIQGLDTPGFTQNSSIRLVNARVSGVSLGTVHSFGEQRVALAGTYGEYSQTAYFLSLESISIARQQ